MHGQPLSSAVDKYNTEIWDSCKALWSVWVPAQLINFAFVPRHLRIPYVAAVSFGWTVIFRCAWSFLLGQRLTHHTMQQMQMPDADADPPHPFHFVWPLLQRDAEQV